VTGIPIKGGNLDRCWWLTPVIVSTQEAKARRIAVQRQPAQTVCETLSQKSPQKMAGGMAQGRGPEFKPQDGKEKKKRRFGRRHKLRKGHVKEEEKKIAIYKPRKEFSEKFSPIRALILYC
jgi:hypothetical protein